MARKWYEAFLPDPATGGVPQRLACREFKRRRCERRAVDSWRITERNHDHRMAARLLFNLCNLLSCKIPVRRERLPNQFGSFFALAKRWHFYRLVLAGACRRMARPCSTQPEVSFP